MATQQRAPTYVSLDVWDKVEEESDDKEESQSWSGGRNTFCESVIQPWQLPSSNAVAHSLFRPAQIIG